MNEWISSGWETQLTIFNFTAVTRCNNFICDNMHIACHVLYRPTTSSPGDNTKCNDNDEVSQRIRRLFQIRLYRQRKIHDEEESSHERKEVIHSYKTTNNNNKKFSIITEENAKESPSRVGKLYELIMSKKNAKHPIEKG